MPAFVTAQHLAPSLHAWGIRHALCPKETQSSGIDVQDAAWNGKALGSRVVPSAAGSQRRGGTLLGAVWRWCHRKRWYWSWALRGRGAHQAENWRKVFHLAKDHTAPLALSSSAHGVGWGAAKRSFLALVADGEG